MMVFVLPRLALVAACGLAGATAVAVPAPPSAASPATITLASDPTLAAAGDIIGDCTTSPCGYQQTAAAVTSLNPTTVLGLGDISNLSGAASDYTGPFNSSWGVFKALIHPVPGNHDYGAAKAVNFFNYFGSAANPPLGYYSFDLGTWHIIAINSNCSQVGGCQAGSAQEQWLKNDLAQHPAACTLAFWHHPRYSSGYGGNNTSMTDVFQDLYDARADVVLSGHSHDYERFAPQNNAGQLDTANGITQFVVGTGGSFFTGFSTIQPNSVARNNNTFGVLSMTLGASSYSYKFVPVAGGTFTDSGSATCHRGGGGGDTSPPTAPAGLTATATSSTSVSLGWTASTDNVGVTGYRVYRGAGGATPSLLATVGGTQTAYTDTSAAAATSYTYQVSAIDAAGNESQRASASVTTPGGGTGTTLAFPVTDDATISQASPATNYGTATRLTADHSPVNDFLVKFNVSGTAGCPITGARLRLTVGSTTDDNSVHGGDFFGVAPGAWSQGTVTWNTAPAPSGGAVASLGSVAVNTAYLVNVTPLVTGDGVVTIRISSTSSDGARYFSSEGSTTQAPQLQVTCGGGASIR
jgi:chitodextrinase